MSNKTSRMDCPVTLSSRVAKVGRTQGVIKMQGARVDATVATGTNQNGDNKRGQ